MLCRVPERMGIRLFAHPYSPKCLEESEFCEGCYPQQTPQWWPAIPAKVAPSAMAMGCQRCMLVAEDGGHVSLRREVLVTTTPWGLEFPAPGEQKGECMSILGVKRCATLLAASVSLALIFIANP